jgi:hypothetical protein
MAKKKNAASGAKEVVVKKKNGGGCRNIINWGIMGFLACAGLIAFSVFGQNMGFIPDATERVQTREIQARMTATELALNPPTETDAPTITPIDIATNTPRPTATSRRPTNAPRITNTPRATSLPRPANCDEAVAMGYTAEQAAQWSHLDRDGDGVACYGD